MERINMLLKKMWELTDKDNFKNIKPGTTVYVVEILDKNSKVIQHITISLYPPRNFKEYK